MKITKLSKSSCTTPFRASSLGLQATS